MPCPHCGKIGFIPKGALYNAEHNTRHIDHNITVTCINCGGKVDLVFRRHIQLISARISDKVVDDWGE